MLAEETSAPKTKTPPHILFATAGSLGDLYPLLVLALEMQARGYTCTIATTSFFKDRIEQAGVRFAFMPPDIADMSVLFESNAIFDKKAMKEAYFALAAIEPKPDLFVSRGFVYAAPILAETTGVPWITTKFFAAECISAFDLPHKAKLSPLFRMIGKGTAASRAIVWGFKSIFRKAYLGPIRELRHELGLPESKHSRYWGNVEPNLDLALFSSLFGAPQPDWPSYARQTGLIFWDDIKSPPSLTPELTAFLDAGPPPIVFTLGSQQFASRNQNFLRVSLEAALKLGQRAVLLTGGAANRAVLPETLPEGIIAVEHAWHGALFPRASVIVNHCAPGTAGVALRAGRPILAVPFALDQPDNARRLAEQGLALIVDKKDYTTDRVAKALDRLLHEPSFAAKAKEAAALIAAEHGVKSTCDLMEEVLRRSTPGSRAARERCEAA